MIFLPVFEFAAARQVLQRSTSLGVTGKSPRNRWETSPSKGVVSEMGSASGSLF